MLLAPKVWGFLSRKTTSSYISEFQQKNIDISDIMMYLKLNCDLKFHLKNLLLTKASNVQSFLWTFLRCIYFSKFPFITLNKLDYITPNNIKFGFHNIHSQLLFDLNYLEHLMTKSFWENIFDNFTRSGFSSPFSCSAVHGHSLVLCWLLSEGGNI